MWFAHARNKKGEHEYLNDTETKHMITDMEKYFELRVETPLIRQGKRQKLESLISEEVLLLTRALIKQSSTKLHLFLLNRKS